MTVRIMAKDRQEAREVARHLRLQEWQFVDGSPAFVGTSRPVIVLAPGCVRHERHSELMNMGRAVGAFFFEVDAWREKFMKYAIYVKDLGNDRFDERETYVHDESDARSFETDGWEMVWCGGVPK